LTSLELGAQAHHRMKDRAPELARVSLSKAHVSRKLAELAERTGDLSFADPTRGIPRRIELHHAAERSGLLRLGRFLVDERERRLEVMIDRLARDEEPHDLRRPLE